MPEKFTCPFCYTPHPLCVVAAEEVKGYLSVQSQWDAELAEGKMFGVLVVRMLTGDIAYLVAYSGNLAHSNKHDFFVSPVFDLLDPDGFFVQEERQISNINEDIENIRKNEEYLSLQSQLTELKVISGRRIEDAKLNIKLAKAERDKRRRSTSGEEEQIAMIRESQFLKAELKRLERSLQEQEKLLRERLCFYESKVNALAEERKIRSFALQRCLFDSSRVLNAKGEERSLYDIFEDYAGKLPPAGAGECAAPKLLQYAYKHKMQPIAMAEFWWERLHNDVIAMNEVKKQSPEFVVRDGLRRHGSFYPACKSKCEPILDFMLQGLDIEDGSMSGYSKCDHKPEIIYEDEWLVVVNKPAGMLSVPGKNGNDSVYSLMKQRYPDASGPVIVHRLDMDTSGLMIITKTKDVHKAIQKLFAMGEVEKCYAAILDGVIGGSFVDVGKTGTGSITNESIADTASVNKPFTISLPLCLDPDERPRQMVNYKYGKPAVTLYKILERTDKYTTVLFYPQTGRTHQLRVHAAHSDGLNIPIKGDRLYGKSSDRLYLHAQSIKFIHPVTREEIYVEKKADFL